MLPRHSLHWPPVPRLSAISILTSHECEWTKFPVPGDRKSVRISIAQEEHCNLEKQLQLRQEVFAQTCPAVSNIPSSERVIPEGFI